jgi:4-amino-4-deoxy-L-arabinose transferase-like glycosyltransferase
MTPRTIEREQPLWTGLEEHISPQESNFLLLRIGCWFVALALGAIDAWATRFTMFPDGVSYLDVGDAFWRGDWHNAINAYWSPVYPCIVGLFLKLFSPSIYGEYPLVHVVNFLIYVVALICFEFFFSGFVAQQQERDGKLETETGLPRWAWYVVGYSAFISSSLLLITVSFVSGDMGIAAIVYLACALLLRIRNGNAGWVTFACLGLVLGIGYLTKAVMFLMSLPFFVVAAVAQRRLAKSMKPAALSLVVFAVTACPLVFLLSKAKGRPTFGDTGKINYAINVGGVNFFIPQAETATHSVRKISGPPAYEYRNPISGTYPLWYDPSYWHEGIQPHFTPKKQFYSILVSVLSCGWISFSLLLGLNITTAILFLYLTASSIPASLSRARLNWILWVPAVCGVALYSLVVIEPRYVGALFCLLWIVAFSGLRFPISSGPRRLMTGTICVVALTTCLVEGWQIRRALDSSYFSRRHIASPVSLSVAAALKSDGFGTGDKLAVIGDWLFPSQEASYIARLVRAQIIGEARPDEFWAVDASTRSQVVAEFAHSGAKAILAYKPPPAESGWERLADSDYYLYRIGSVQ